MTEKIVFQLKRKILTDVPWAARTWGATSETLTETGIDDWSGTTGALDEWIVDDEPIAVYPKDKEVY